MSAHVPLRRPVSTRHAFALAFDLALRRDAVQSLVVPFLLRAPWTLALLVLPGNAASGPDLALLAVSAVALLGGSISWWTVDAMLRFRARSVYATPPEVRPASALQCYDQGLRRLPWLYLTECARVFGLTLAFPVFVLPGVWLGYKLAFSTEAVVLNDRHLSGALQHSFRLSRGRFERWMEMVVVSGFLVLAVLFLGTVLSLLVRGLSWDTWKAVTFLLIVALWPVFQYAWTFFYLRLIEVEEPPLEEVGPAYAAADAIASGPAAVFGAGQPSFQLVEPGPPVEGGDAPA